MSYGLGVDLGTTHTAAAVNVDGRVDPVRLGSQKPEMPSLVFLRPDGGVLVGEAAQRRGQVEPARLAREFKRRMGDPVPIMLGGAPLSAHALTARVLTQVVETVTLMRGGPPGRTVVTHPANWGPYKREQLTQAVRLADLRNVTLVREPEAAAVRYAGTERVAAGEIIAVYDLGGGTFDAAVLRKSPDGFVLLGEPEGIEQLGGIDFDEAVLEHVRATLGDALADLDPGDDETNASLARLRRECVEAKETLSYDTEAVVAVALPRLHTRVRINRSQFEETIAPSLDETVAAMRRALRSAEVGPEHLHRIVLTGGSARIPLVSQVLSTAFERSVSLDETPELGIALGAAMLTVPAPDASRQPPAAAPDGRPAHPAPPVVTSSRPEPPPVPPSAGVSAPAGPGPAAESPASDRRVGSATRSAGPPAEPVGQVSGTVIGRAPAPPVTARVNTPAVRGPATGARGPAAGAGGPGAGAGGPGAGRPGTVVGGPGAGGQWRRYRWPIVGAAVATVLVIAAAYLWPRGDASPPDPASAASASAPAVTVLWRAATGGSATGPPIGSADRIFVGGADGVIRAFRRADGQPDWTFRTGKEEVFLSRVLDEKVYGGTADGVLYGVDAGTGKQRWREPTGDTFVARPAVYPNHVYVGGRSGVLYSYARDRSRLWRVWTGGEIRASPQSVGSIVVAASRDRRLYAVNTQNQIVWKPSVGQVVGSPIAVGGAVCVTLEGGSITCRTTDDGSPAGRIDNGGDLSAPVGADGMIYAAAADGTVRAWDAPSGAPRWQYRPTGGTPGAGRLALRDAMLHVVYPDGRLAAIDPVSGAERWRFTIDDRFDAQPWVDGGVLYVAGATGTLYALQVPVVPTTPAVAPPSTPDPLVTSERSTGTSKRELPTQPSRTRRTDATWPSSADPSGPTPTTPPTPTGDGAPTLAGVDDAG